MSRAENPTRDRILSATLQLLENGGANAIRMSDIAKASKISRQALYLHFPNRAELLIATTRHLDQVHDIQNQLAGTRTAATGRKRLAAWVDVWGNYIPTIYGVAKALLAMRDTDAEASAAWDDRMAAMREGCAAAVAALKRDGDLVAGISEVEATDLLWTLLSVRNWEHLRRDCGWSHARYLDVMRQTAEQALTKP